VSIYCSVFGLDEHKPRCARIKKLGPKLYQEDDTKPCTCGVSPIKYQGSHVLPSNKDERGGDLGFAAIPSHITRNRKDNGAENGWLPWLRFHLNGGYQDSLILTRKQVTELRDCLNVWMDKSAPPPR